MTKVVLVFVSLLCFLTNSYSQIVVSQTGTVAQWVQNVLTGSGVTVSNVIYTGDLQSIATFTTGPSATNLGIGAGMILCTGNAMDVLGPAAVFASSTTSGGSDPLLDALIPQPINDAAILEFDFIPLSDTVKFRYVFGSEEYPNFVPVGSSGGINDVFGFFINGINPAGGMYVNENVALVPGTTVPVAIFNVNNGNSGNNGPCVNCNYYINNIGGTSISYGGFTTPLYAVFNVIPCFSYHIKLVIGDAQDNIYDSGVFLEANSFGADIINLSSATTNSIDTIAVEGCNDAVIKFHIPYVTSVNKTFYFGLNGTAINGVDYQHVNQSVTILAGYDTASVIISPILDGVTEGIETVQLVVATSPCTYDTIQIYIQDNSALNCNLPSDTTLCGSDTMTINSLVSGGHQPYTYLWSNGATTANIFIAPTASSPYSLTVTDICNADTTADIIVGYSDPHISFIGDSVCIHDTASITVLADATYTILWSTGETTLNIEFPVSASAYYSVVATDTIGCVVVDSTFVDGFVAPIAIVSPDTVICKGDVATLRAFGNYHTYEWSNGQLVKNIAVSPNSLSRYFVTVTSLQKCWDTTSVEVDVLAVPQAVITGVDTVCKGASSELFASLADLYQWSTGDITPSISVQPVQETTYTVRLTNVFNSTQCSHETSFVMNVQRCNFIYLPSAFTPNGDGLNDGFGVEGEFVGVTRFRLYIFNRYGEKIFETIDPYQKWDGTYNGNKVKDGVYTYIVEVSESLGDNYVLKGTVQLFR